MKNVFDFRFNIYVLGITISSIAERTITYLINNYTILKFDPGGFGYHTMSLIILVALFLLSNFLLKKLVNNDFVTKLAWKKQYVSGQWVEVVVNTNNEVSHITNMELKCDISEITVQGKCHLPDEYAQKKGMIVNYYTFDSVCSKFDVDGHTLHYSFIQKGKTKDPKPFYGFLDFLSTCEKGLFNKYIGNFDDGENNFNVFAIKIDNKDRALFSRLNKQFKKTAINEILPEIEKIHGLSKLKLPPSFLNYKNEYVNGVTIMVKKVSVLIDSDTIAVRVKELAKSITKDFNGENLLCICILKGAVIFMADLVKHIRLPTDISYMAVSSYNNQTESSGDIKIELDLAADITGRNVLIIEDIVDSGQTVDKLCNILSKRNPKKIKVCALINRPDRRKIPVQLDYTGFTISNKFLVGYGLDYAEQYRNLPYIGVLEDTN